jgi:hypothetical protein
MTQLFVDGQKYLKSGDYTNAKSCFSQLMHHYEEIPFDQYPKILEYLHLTLALEMVSHFQKEHPDVASRIYDYLSCNPCYREHFSQPDFAMIESLLNADQL